MNVTENGLDRIFTPGSYLVLPVLTGKPCIPHINRLLYNLKLYFPSAIGLRCD